MLSQNEKTALQYLALERAVLITQIPDKNEKGLFGDITPGIRVYQSLDKKGLVIITDEDEDESGFTWTPMVEITDAGIALVKTMGCT